jgi:membrane protein implicated in regulation of membrane protease activity
VRTLAKYVALQVPGWAAAALILWGLVEWVGLPVWAALLLFAADVAKDAVLFPFLRHAYSDAPSKMVGVESLVGAIGVAEGSLEPSGWVRVEGERWRGASLSGPLEAGQAVVVSSVRGLTLQVHPTVEAQETGDR